MSGNIKLLLYIFFVVVIFLFIQDRFSIFDISFSNSKDKQVKNNEEEVVEKEMVEIINVNGNSILVSVEIADDYMTRAVGLSGRRALGDYEGMLFVMEEVGTEPFWMKDMLMSLDMIFINENGVIVDIKEGLPPCEANFCPYVISEEPFLYVLEVNGGFSKTNYIQVGNTMIFNISSMD
jgi:uncharacterized protein